MAKNGDAFIVTIDIQNNTDFPIPVPQTFSDAKIEYSIKLTSPEQRQFTVSRDKAAAHTHPDERPARMPSDMFIEPSKKHQVTENLLDILVGDIPPGDYSLTAIYKFNADFSFSNSVIVKVQ